MTPRRVLFVGGTADGQWHNVAHGGTHYRIPVPLAPISIGRDVPSTEPFRIHDYQIERFMVFGHTVWLAMFDELRSHDRETAAIRALFQRDVADQLARGQ